MPGQIKMFLRRRYLFPLLLGLLILMVRNFLANVTPSELQEIIKSADRGRLLSALGLYVTSLFLFTARWRISLSTLDIRPAFLTVFLAVLSGLFANNTTPLGRAGGEPTRVLVLKRREGIPLSPGFASILAERVLETWAVLLVLALGMGLFLSDRGDFFAGLWFIGGWAAVLLAVTLIIVWAVRKKMGTGIASRLLRYPMHDTELFYEQSYQILCSRNAVIIFLTSALIWGLEFLRIWLVLSALGLSASFHVVVLGDMTLLFASMIPFTPGGIGLVEFSMATVFSSLGVPHGIAISAALMERCFSYLLATLLGFGAVTYLGLRE
jgi:hypothetical protein